MNSKINSILRQIREKFEALYRTRLVKIVLFGSQARQDWEEGSDIDLMVVLKGNVDPGEEITRTGEVNSALSLLHNTVISCVFVAEERFLNENSPLMLNVRKEGIPV